MICLLLVPLLLNSPSCKSAFTYKAGFGNPSRAFQASDHLQRTFPKYIFLLDRCSNNMIGSVAAPGTVHAFLGRLTSMPLPPASRNICCGALHIITQGTSFVIYLKSSVIDWGKHRRFE